MPDKIIIVNKIHFVDLSSPELIGPHLRHLHCLITRDRLCNGEACRDGASTQETAKEVVPHMLCEEMPKLCMVGETQPSRKGAMQLLQPERLVGKDRGRRARTVCGQGLAPMASGTGESRSTKAEREWSTPYPLRKRNPPRQQREATECKNSFALLGDQSGPEPLEVEETAKRPCGQQRGPATATKSRAKEEQPQSGQGPTSRRGVGGRGGNRVHLQPEPFTRSEQKTTGEQQPE
eukprot:1202199-Karenia_brevis.AAC.1